MQMGKLQNALDKSLANLPRLGIEKIIRDKLSAAGVEDEELVGQVAEVIADGNTGHFTRSEEHTSELQSLMRISYAVFCLKKKNNNLHTTLHTTTTPQPTPP